MYKYFLKPLGIIIGIYFLTAIGIAADIAQLTNFNLLNFLKTHSPQSYYFLISGTLFLFIIIVIIEYIRNKSTQGPSTPDSNSGQYISTRNVKNSTFIQIRKGKED